MATYSELNWMKRQLNETRRLLEENKDSLIMRVSLEDRIELLEKQIQEIGEIEPYDATLRMWFGGKAVYGSKGIFADFAAQTAGLMSNMVSTKYSQILTDAQDVAQKGKLKGVPKGKMFISHLLHGSFGFEMGWVQDNLFSDEFASDAIQQVMKLISITAKDQKEFDQSISNEPVRMISYLRKFYKTVATDSNILKMESGATFEELNTTELTTGYTRIKETITNEEIKTVEGVYEGALLESGLFEFADEEGKFKKGEVSDNLTQEQLISYNQQYSHRECRMAINVISVSPRNGNAKVTYELLGITDKA